jgi:Zn-dependent protease
LLDIDVTQVAIGLLILLISLTVHEAAHAWSADKLGDGTARALGRVSLNPIVHIDPIGTLVFPLIAIVTNLPIIGWARPVPVNVRQLGVHWRQKFMAIAAAGPASNLGIAAAAAGALWLVSPAVEPFQAASPGPIAAALETTIFLNVLLAVFNLVPVPPLDGGNVLSGLLRGPAASLFDALRPYGFVILYALMFTGTLWRIISPPAGFLLSLLGVS